MTEEPLIEISEIPSEKPRQPLWVTIAWEILQTLVMAAVLYFLIDTFIGRVRVENVSMQPTLYADEFLLVNKFAYRWGNVDHGDVVVFHYPLDPTQDYIKRVIGLPGDMVEVKNGTVYVNEIPLKEAYILAPPGYTGTWSVPEGQYFVLGDNRNSSHDSHVFGFIPHDSLVGRALVVYWPLNQFKILSHPNIVQAGQTK